MRSGLSSGRRGSNPRPTAWEAVALPTELLPHISHFKARTANLRFNFFGPKKFCFQPAVLHWDDPFVHQLILRLHGIVEIQALAIEESIFQRIRHLRHRHHLYLILYQERQVQPVEHRYTKLLLYFLYQSYGTVCAASADACCRLVRHEYNELTIEQVAIPLHRRPM